MRLPLLYKKNKRQRQREWRQARRKEKVQRFKDHLTRRYWAHFLGYVGRKKGLLAAVIGLVLLSAGLEVVLPQIVRFVIDRILPERNTSLLSIVVLAGCGIYIVHAACRYYEQKAVATFSMEVMTAIRRDLFDFQLRLPLSYFEKFGSGKLISKLTYSAYMIKLLIETFAYVCFRELALIVGIVIAAASIDWRLTLVLAALGPVFIFYMRYLNRRMEVLAGELQTKNDQILKILSRTFGSIRLFKIYGAEKREVGKLDQVLREDKEHRVRRTMIYALNAIGVSLLTSLLTLAALWGGGSLVIRGGMTAGELTAYLFYLAMLFRPVSEFIKASAYLQAGRVAVKTVFSVYENYEPVAEPARPVNPKKREGSLQFQDVWHRRSAGGAGLRGLSFRVKPGEKVLIVGPSGSGKSMLFHLLLRLYDADRGSILLDGVNVKHMRLEDLRRSFTVVTQEALHADDGLLANLSLGGDEADLPSALRGLEEFQLAEKVALRDRKLDQRIDGSDQGFSRGELQKLALLRAAARNAPVVLLDEPTASMDAVSERRAMEFIGRAFAGKTVVLISHRPHSLFRPDWIVMMKEGRIEAQGAHHYLLKNSSSYRQWLSPQAPSEQIVRFP